MTRSVAILGGGISGLVCAWALQKKFGKKIHITLIEKDNRLGGWIKTAHHQGFLFEQGPRSFRPTGTGLETLRLIEELGLQDQVIVADPSAHKRYLYTNSQLQQLPTGFFAFLRSPLMRGTISALLHDAILAKKPTADESIYDFVSKRLSREIADRLIDPMISGIYAGDVRKLSMQACFPPIFSKGSFVRAAFSRKKTMNHYSPFMKKMEKVPLFSFKEGTEILIKKLCSQLEVDIKLCCMPKRLSFQSDKVTISLNNGTIIEADQLFSALPAHAIGSLLDLNEGSFLNEIPLASVAVVNLGYRKKVLNKQGFGYLIPSIEKEKILGCVWDSSIFPQQTQTKEETRLTVMLGGMHHPHVEQISDEQCVELAQEALSKHLGIEAIPEVALVKKAIQAIPQYEVGYVEKMEALLAALKEKFPRLTLLGNSIHGVAVNDCVASAMGTVGGSESVKGH